MPNLSIRGVEDAALQHIKSAASRRGVSVNAYLVELIRREAEAAEFEATQRDFALVDPALWPDAEADGSGTPAPCVTRPR